jgi:hypothetical protein
MSYHDVISSSDVLLLGKLFSTELWAREAAGSVKFILQPIGPPYLRIITA